nr:ubiquitin conjugation factor e4 [Quercus suber]
MSWKANVGIFASNSVHGWSHEGLPALSQPDFLVEALRMSMYFRKDVVVKESAIRQSTSFALAHITASSTMADSTQSDADKIRAKRLAKLGGSGSTMSNNSTSAAPSPAQPSSPATVSASQPSAKVQSPPPVANPVTQLEGKEEQEKKPNPSSFSIKHRAVSPAKRERDGSERPRPKQVEKSTESLDVWQDRTLRSIFRVTLDPEQLRDVHGHALVFLASTQDDLTESKSPWLINVEVLESAITEAASHVSGKKPFEYLLQCFKRTSRVMRSTKYSGPEDPKSDILKEAKRLCMSYCILSVTVPDLFGENAPESNPLVDHLLAEPECDTGICTDFLTEASSRFEDDESIKEVIVGAAEELSRRLSVKDMLGDYQNYMRALRNLVRFPKIVDAITQSSMWIPNDVEPEDIETKTLLGPFFRLSPMQLEVAQSYFSAPKTRDRAFIANAQNAIRLTLRNQQLELFQIADQIVRAGTAPRERILNWFALCVNKNHKKRAMRVDYKTVSSDGFMVNVTVTLDGLCEPFMDAKFSKIEKIDVNYLRRQPRVDVSDETKINSDQKAAEAFYAQKVDGTNNFISEVFFLTVAAHHYGTEAAQTRMATLRKTVKRAEQDLELVEADRHKYLNDPRYLARFEEYIQRARKQIDDNLSTMHATNGVVLDDLMQARSMQFMRYVIVWLLRLASQQDIPRTSITLPLQATQSDVVKCLPEYFMEDIVENFKFVTGNIPHIITPQQSEEIVQFCITFLRSSEYVKNPSIKSGLVTILFYGVQPLPNRALGVLGDLLIGSKFANNHLLHSLMKYYIEAESTGTHTQFYDKFNIRYEIFAVIKSIWVNTLYRENLAKEASINTDFFVQFVNMVVNDVTFVLDESLSSFVKIHDLSKEIESPAFNALSEEQRKEKQDLLEQTKGTAKSYMGLTSTTMETLILFTETLPESFTMPEIVQRLADMLDYNLDSMVGPKSTNLVVKDPEQYKFHPKVLLQDIIKVFLNLSSQQPFIQAIARDGRSYKPSNFEKVGDMMDKRKIIMAPEQQQSWKVLSDNVVEAKRIEEEEEEDYGDAPEEFMDPLLSDIMKDPVVLPTSRNVLDRSTIRSHLLSDPTDPFNRMPLRIEDVIPDTALKARIEEWKAQIKADKANKMDTS